MYALYIYIYGNIYIYHQYTPNVGIYTSTMDPMGHSRQIVTTSRPHHYEWCSSQVCLAADGAVEESEDEEGEAPSQ